MHLGQLALELAFQTRAVGINAGNGERAAIGATHIGQQLSQVFFQLLCAAPQRADVDIATTWASTRHGLCETAMVATQSAVEFMKHAVRAAMRAFAFPTAIHAMQHRCVATAVEQHQRLFAARHTLAHGVEQGRRKNSFVGLAVHVHTPHQRQSTLTDARGHVQAHVAARALLGAGASAVVPTLERRCGGAQNHFGVFKLTAVHRQVACGIPRAFLLFVTGVMFFIDHDEFQMRQ